MYIDIHNEVLLLRITAFLAVFALCIGLLAGCGKENPSATKPEATGQTSATASAGETTTGKLTVDKDGWPKGDVAALIPKPGSGTVISAAQPKAGVIVISLKELAGKDLETYVGQLKKKGFDRNIEESTGDNIRNFLAYNERGASVELVYSSKNEIAVITVKSGS
ncbi:MAG TPA: hypothetical protein PLE55_02255 [Clostridiales bacterium]|nr:hypothetical protein [Clostridiales bacterium]